MIFAELIRFCANIIHIVIWIYIVAVLVRSIISWVGNIPANDLVIFLRRFTNPLFKLTHRVFPFLIVRGIDISPVVILICLHFLDRIIYGSLINYSLTLIQRGALK